MASEKIRIHQVPSSPRTQELFHEGAVQYLSMLMLRFHEEWKQCLERRQRKKIELNQGKLPQFLEETRDVRTSRWCVLSPPAQLLDRKVDIVVANLHIASNLEDALLSQASGIQADFDDAHCPSWENTLKSQLNLWDAVRGRLSSQQSSSFEWNWPQLLVRPRSLHLCEYHVTVGVEPCAGALVDFGLYVYHNSKLLIDKGSGPYFYLPKLQNHQEARFWCRVFEWTEHQLNLPVSSIRCIVLIEDILAAFEMEEILYELRNYCVALNAGRWDYTFSFIRQLHYCLPHLILPDRAKITMNTKPLQSYSQLLLKTCWLRGAMATAGMSPQVVKVFDNLEVERIMETVLQSKQGEAESGYDGALVFSPVFVNGVKQIFSNANLSVKNAEEFHTPLLTMEEEFTIADDLLSMPTGLITQEGLILNLNVVFHYITAWIRGSGHIVLNGVVEDAATAEISRAQIWQWLDRDVIVQDETETGFQISQRYIEKMLDEIHCQSQTNTDDSIIYPTSNTQVLDLALQLTHRILFRSTPLEFMTSFLHQQLHEMRIFESKL